MKIAILGGGGAFALNFARVCHERGIQHFGIGRSQPLRPFWVVHHHYPYRVLHLVDQLDAAIAVLDTERPDVIVNFAAQGEGAASFGENAPDFFRTNLWGFSRLILGLQNRDYLRRFVHIGSSEVYGSVDRPAKETDDLRPSSPYAISKAAFDQYLNTMAKVHHFPMNIVRPSNCYTPGQRLHRVIPKAIICAFKKEKLRLEGGGKAQKSYLHATDLSRAIFDVIDRAPLGKTYNVGPASPIAIRTLVSAVADACDVSFDDLAMDVPDRIGQDAKYHLDATEIAKDCGWTQTINILRGLETMVRWVNDYPELLTMNTSYQHRL